MSRFQLIFIGLIGLLVVFFALVFLGVIPGLRSGSEKTSATLSVWGVFDDPSVFQKLISQYQQTHPNIRVNYRQMNDVSYEQDLVNAAAAGIGPDIFMVHNTWLPKHYDKMSPFSAESLPINEFRNLYPSVVEQDFAPDGTVYALPLYLDTLAMYYNKDIFDSEGIAVPPKTWEEIVTLVPKLRRIDSIGRINRAAVALGGSNKSINRASDILAALMLQSGVEMTSKDFTRATFSNGGDKALSFYTTFANPNNQVFTWQEQLHYSLDNFAAGNTAIMFNYSHQIPLLRSKNPFLNFGVVVFPQLAQAAKPVAYPNYWGLAVSARSQNKAAAQEFIFALTASEQLAGTYSDSTKRPAALRSLIGKKINDPEYGVFASQALIARSWPQVDNASITNIFSEMIESVINGRADIFTSINRAQEEVSRLMRLRAK